MAESQSATVTTTIKFQTWQTDFVPERRQFSPSPTRSETAAAVEPFASGGFGREALSFQADIARFRVERDFQEVSTARTLAANGGQIGGNGFVEKYPGAQNLKFSETKAAERVAYVGKVGDIYEFPDGRRWRVVDAVNTPRTGFQAVVLKPLDPNDDRVIVSYAGSNDRQDWITNFRQAGGETPTQYRQAVDLARKYQNKYGDRMILTGHSLGGGLASYASLQTGLRATAVNAAPLAPNNLGGNPFFNPRVAQNPRITQYYVPGEALTEIDQADLFMARPGNAIAVPGKYRRLDPRAEFLNHLIGNVAPDVPLPVKVN